MSESIIGALIGVGGVIIGAYISYIYSLGVVRRTEFIKACVEFKIAFSDLVHWLKYDAIIDSIRTPGKLKETHKIHKDAINKFRIFLSDNKRQKFDISCEKFYNKKDNHYYFGYAGLDTSPQKESREIVLKNISELFDFAEY